MSPQHSNRQALIEGTLLCLEESSSSQITARQIATASKANLASIGYHFGSTDALIASAMAEGFKRWLQELASEMGDLAGAPPAERIQQASEIAIGGFGRHQGLIRTFLAAVARAPHDEELRSTLAESYREARAEVASLLGLGDDADAANASLLMLATFDGLLIQAVLSSGPAVSLEDLNRGLVRLASVTQAQDN